MIYFTQKFSYQSYKIYYEFSKLKEYQDLDNINKLDHFFDFLFLNKSVHFINFVTSILKLFRFSTKATNPAI